MKINFYLAGIPWEDTIEDAEDELRSAFGTLENCLMIDVRGEIIFNTTDIEIEKMWCS